jgi:hypothetical protein
MEIQTQPKERSPYAIKEALMKHLDREHLVVSGRNVAHK